MKYIVDNVKLEDVEDVVEKILDDMDDSYFKDYLDEVYGEIEICGCTYYASTVLEKVDEIAYSVYKNDYKDSLYSDIYAKIEKIEPGGSRRIYDTTVACIDEECDENEDNEDDAEENGAFEALLFP